jgi:hypothetical protein
LMENQHQPEGLVPIPVGSNHYSEGDPKWDLGNRPLKHQAERGTDVSGISPAKNCLLASPFSPPSTTNRGGVPDDE